MSPNVWLPRILLTVLLILFSCYLSIQYFHYVLSVSIFHFKIVLFLLVVDLSLFTLYRLVEFSFVILKYPVLSFFFFFFFFCPVPVPFEFSFFHQYLLIYFYQLYYQIFLQLFLKIFSTYWFLACFTSLRSFACCHSFLIRHSIFIFLLVLYLYSDSFEGYYFITEKYCSCID